MIVKRRLQIFLQSIEEYQLSIDISEVRTEQSQ